MKKQSSALTLIKSHSDAVWTLHGDDFEHLGDPSPSAQDRVSDLAETLLNLAAIHFGDGTRFQCRIGSDLWMGRSEATATLLSWNQAGGNPLLLDSFIEKWSPRPPAPSLPSIPQAADPATLEADTAVRDTQQPDESLPPDDLQPPVDSSEPTEELPNRHQLDDTRPVKQPRRWERDRQTGTVISLTKTANSRVESISISSQNGLDEESDLEFEIRYTADSDLTPSTDAPQNNHTTAPKPTPTAHKEVTRWADFEGIIQVVTDQAKRLIGDKVTTNYWRKALSQDEGQLTGLVSVHRSQGLTFMEPDVAITPQEITWLLELTDRWLEACARIVPTEAQTWRRMIGEKIDDIVSSTRTEFS